MALEIDDVKKELDENEELRNGVLSHVNQSEWGKSFVENTGKSYFEQNRDALISPVVKEIHSKYDEDYKEIFGEDKPDGVKTYEAYKKKIQEIKSGDGSKAEIEKWKNQAEKLKQEMESGEGSKHYKELYEQIQSKANEREQELLGQLDNFKKEVHSSKVKNELNSALNEFKLNESINENLRKDTINRIFSNLATSSQEVDGVLIFKDGEGKTITNDLNAPITAKELVEKELKRYDLLEKERKATGGGSDGSKGNLGKDNEGNDVLTLDVTGIKTKVELTKTIQEVLTSKGIGLHSEQGVKLADEAYKRYGEGMPLQ